MYKMHMFHNMCSCVFLSDVKLCRTCLKKTCLKKCLKNVKLLFFLVEYVHGLLYNIFNQIKWYKLPYFITQNC